jgi:uncharacterized protein YsxB (DUF464 family)
MLAQKDATTPFRAVMVCGAVKAILNVTLLALDRFGAVESAAATVVSQFLAMTLLLRWNAADGRKVQWNWSVRPGVGNVAPFAECLGPLTGVYVLKNVCYVLVNSAATSQVFLAVAAHQSMYSVWVLLAFCATPLERAAISFLPTAKPGEVVELEELLAGMALGLGAALGAVCAAVALLCPDILSQDERVWEFFAGVAPQAFLSLTVNALDAAFNGILLARRDFTFLLSAMAATMVVLYAYNSWLVDQGAPTSSLPPLRSFHSPTHHSNSHFIHLFCVTQPLSLTCSHSSLIQYCHQLIFGLSLMCSFSLTIVFCHSFWSLVFAHSQFFSLAPSFTLSLTHHFHNSLIDSPIFTFFNSMSTKSQYLKGCDTTFQSNSQPTLCSCHVVRHDIACPISSLSTPPMCSLCGGLMGGS